VAGLLLESEGNEGWGIYISRERPEKSMQAKTTKWDITTMLFKGGREVWSAHGTAVEEI
jgi:hypothetical protein